MAKRRKYKPDFDRQAFLFCKQGSIDLDLIELFNCVSSTLYKWKKDFPSFAEAIRKGKDSYDCSTAENSLKKLVEGYQAIESKAIFKRDKDTGKDVVIRKEITKKEVGPNANSVKWFLFNRNRPRWGGDESQSNITINNTNIDNSTNEEKMKKRGLPIPTIDCPDSGDLTDIEGFEDTDTNTLEGDTEK